MGKMEVILTIFQGLFFFLLIAGMTWYMGRRMGKRMAGGRFSVYMESLDRLIIGQDKYLEIVRIGEKSYLLGVSQSGIQLLTELEDKDMVKIMRRQAADGTFRSLLERMTDKKNAASDTSSAPLSDPPSDKST